MLSLVLVVCAAGCGGSKTPAGPGDPDDPGELGPDAMEVPEPTPFTDGICTPAPVTSGIYDADCVYLIGTTQPGSSGREVIATFATPDEFSYGFGDHPVFGAVRHTDGKVLFTDADANGDTQAFAFTPDPAPTSPTDRPTQRLANDAVIATPGCGDRGTARLSVFPDDGVAAYQCFQLESDPPENRGQLFLEDESTPFVPGASGSLVALGAGRHVLLEREGTLSLASGGTVTPIVAPPFTRVVAARFLERGFSVVLATFGPRGVDLALAQIDLAGRVTPAGTFDVGTANSFFIDCKLAPDRSLICPTEVGLDETISRFTTTAPPVTIFDEREHQLQLHGAKLVTGS
jgi:hypothetical protein